MTGKLELKLDALGKGTIFIDGKDRSKNVGGITIRTKPNELTIVELEMGNIETSIELTSSDIRQITVPPKEIRAKLRERLVEEMGVIDQDSPLFTRLYNLIGESYELGAKHATNGDTRLLVALKQMQSLIGVMHGEGPEAVIPETVLTPIGVPIKLSDIMRDINTLIVAKAGL